MATVEETKQLLLHQLEILHKKEEELAATLRALDANFRELGYQIDTSVDATKKKSAIQTGIRVNGELSFRGKEKAAEYFDFLDVDKDGFLNFEDFRGNNNFLFSFVKTHFIGVSTLISVHFTNSFYLFRCFLAVRGFTDSYGFVDCPEVQNRYLTLPS
jgi:hypothetical protein